MSLHPRSWSVFVALAGCALSQPGCGTGERGSLGETTQPTWDGDDSVLDTANEYNAVASLSVGCSGVLVSPFWVLTAAHCFDDEDPATVVVTATFNWNPFDTTAITRTHDPTNSGPVLLRISDPVHADLNHVAQDLALFRLDERVPSDVARPIHAPQQESVCPGGGPTGFTGTAIGFGNSFPAPVSCGPIDKRRRYSTHDGYDRLWAPDGTLYNKTYTNSLTFCSEYSGVAKGDSGGAFIDTSGHLCGIISGFLPPGPDPVLWVLTHTSNHMAGVDSVETVEWLASAEANGHAFQELDGTLEGECPAYLETCTAGGCDDTNSDGDELVDVCDACPHHSNNSADGDGDGIPDCLDPCPADAREADAPACDDGGDFDCDGRCDGSDNCPYRQNATQTNSNDEVEAVWSAGVMGDACEPVPVPRALAAPATVAESVSFDNSFFGEKYQLLIQDEIRVRAQPSRRTRSRKTGTTSVVVPNVPTHFRFCQESTTEPPCDDASLVNETQLHLEVPNAALESPSFRYHRVTMEFSPTRGAAKVVNYDNALYEWRWSYEADAAWWKQTGIVDVPGPEWSLFVDPGPASGLGGRFWVHAQTAAGTVGNDVGTGTHGPASLGGTEQLASRYFELDPEHATHQFWSYPLRLWRPLFIWQTLVDPPPYERYGVIVSANPGDAEILVPVEGGDVGFLNLDGTAQPLKTRVGDSLRRTFLDVSLIWASAAEGVAPTGKEHEHPSAVAVPPDGTAVVQRAWVGADKIEGDVGSGGGAGAGAVRASTRTGFVPVYSRSLGRVFLVGGNDAAGAATGNVVASSVAGSAWSVLPPPIALAKVLAATFSFRDRSLYVIDEASARTGVEVRLIRIDAVKGGGAVIARWQAAERYRTGLVADVDGNVLLSLSSERLGRHTLVSYDVDTGAALRLISGDGLLLAPALGDANGHVLYTGTREGRTQGRRFESLAGVPIALQEAWTVR